MNIINRLFIQGATWPKNTDLYNFECKQPIETDFHTSINGYIIRENECIGFHTNPPNEAKLCYIDFDKENNFFLASIYDNSLPENDMNKTPFIVINSILYANNNKGYEISEGDIMKFGRLRLKVRKIHFVNKPKTVNPISKEIDNSSKLCRICYTNDSSSPLISPCNCTGSLRYVHLSCLQKWIMSKVQLSINEKKTCFKYTLNPVQCEICKTFLPDYYKKDNLLYEICEYPTSCINFISLETILCGKYNTKVIYVINLDAPHQDLFTIGRTRNCDLCVSDITISRLHAGLYVENERIYLRDEGAKFGTSVLVQNKQFRLNDNKGISFQFGKSIITVVQRPGIIQNLFCMCCGKEDNFLYWEENRKGIDFEKDYLIKEDKTKIDDTVEEDKNMLHANKGKTGFVEIEVAKEDNEELKHKQTELYVE